MRVSVQQEPFDPGEILSAFTKGRRDLGAVVTFTGIVRDLEERALHAMEIEHYPGMTEKALEKISQEAKARFSLGDTLVIHRFGRLLVGETIMMVATAAPHRKDAFAGADFLMDYLKSRAPFWKREISDTGTDWVIAKEDDEAALASWD